MLTVLKQADDLSKIPTGRTNRSSKKCLPTWTSVNAVLRDEQGVIVKHLSNMHGHLVRPLKQQETLRGRRGGRSRNDTSMNSSL